MEKIYGFKQKDLEQFAKFISKNQQIKPTEIFKNYAKISGKAVGTIRNLYYAVAEYCKKNQQFCQTFFNGKGIEISEISPFSKDEEIVLLENIFTLIKKGLSVRKAVNQLAENNVKLALRYQNKFRSIKKNNPKLFYEIANKHQVNIKNSKEQKNIDLTLCSNKNSKNISNLKQEINALVEKISVNIKKENIILQEKVKSLQNENLCLLKLLYEQNEGVFNKKSAYNYFFNQKNKNLLN